MTYIKYMEFIETSIFTKTITELITDEEFSEFQNFLAENPEAGDIIVGGSGIRKVRWNLKNRGKSGSMRVIYFYKVIDNQIFLLYVYTKNSKSDLSETEKKLFGTIAKEFAK